MDLGPDDAGRVRGGGNDGPCEPCHSPGGSGVASMIWNDQASVQADAAQIVVRSVNSDDMPRNGTPMSALDKAKLQIWVWQGAN